MASTQHLILSGARTSQSNEKLNQAVRILMGQTGRGQPAVITGSKTLNYADLVYKSDVIATYLLEKNKKSLKQPVVGVFMNMSEECIISMLAVFKAKACYFPIDPCFRSDKIPYVVRKANVCCILTSESLIPKLSPFVGAGISIYEIDSLLQNPDRSIKRCLLEEDNQHELACVILTSENGDYVGVRLSHRNILNRIGWQWRAFPLTPDERISVIEPLPVVDLITHVLYALLKGIPVVVVPTSVKSNPSSLLPYLRSHDVTRVNMAPTTLKAILAYLDTHPGTSADLKIKTFITTTEGLTRATLSKFFKHFPDTEVATNYGCTEVTGVASSFVFEKKSFQKSTNSISSGQPVDNTSVFVVNSCGKLTERGERGEICVSGANVALGYQEQIANKFLISSFGDKGDGQDVMFKTGDYGYVKDGLLYSVGNPGSQVTLNGVQIELIKIDEALQSIASVADSAVTYDDSMEPSSSLLAFCIIDDGDTCIEEISTKLKSILPSEVIPKIITVKEFPLLMNGKIDKLLLLKQYQEEYCKKEENTNINELLTIVKDVTGVDLDGEIMSKTVYELGGSSLAIVEIIVGMEKAGYRVDPIMLNICTLEVLGSLQKGIDLSVDVGDMDGKFHIREVTEHVSFEVTSNILASAFTQRHCLDRAANVKPEDHIYVMKQMWSRLIEERYSFVACNDKDEIVGVMINTDFFREPEVQVPERLLPIFMMHEPLENRGRAMLSKSGKRWLHNVFLATSSSLSAAENVLLVVFMETKLLEHAKQHGFEGIFVINSSQVTQAVCNHILNYREAEGFDVHDYVYKGIKPFSDVPDEVKLIASYKYI